jgi:hypothetical protein
LLAEEHPAAAVRMVARLDEAVADQ